MKIQNRGRFYFTAILLVFTLVIIVISFQYRPSARQIPLIFSIPTALLCILMLVAERYPQLIKVFDVSLQDLVKDSSKYKGKEVSTGATRGGALVTLAWILGYFFSVVLIGFLISTPLFTLTYLTLQWRIAILKALAISILLFLILHFGFNMFMYADLFKGILFGGITPPL